MAEQDRVDRTDKSAWAVPDRQKATCTRCREDWYYTVYRDKKMNQPKFGVCSSCVAKEWQEKLRQRKPCPTCGNPTGP